MTINYDKDKFFDRWKGEGRPYIDVIGRDGSGFVEWLKKYDPSIRNKYVNWMIIRYLRGDIKRLEDIPSRISGALKTYMGLFNKKKLKDEHRDINRIRNIEDVVEEYCEIDVTSKSEMGDKFVSDGEAEIVYDGEDYKIVVPKTREASCYFGRNTRWCTAAREENEFEDCNKDGPLYVILHKASNTRWQFHFASVEYMDERDEDINIIEFFKNHKKVMNVFKNLGLFQQNSDKEFRVGYAYYNSDGEKHRDGGPALTFPDGREFWFKNDKLHRRDGSAASLPNEGIFWYKNGLKHRLDGPADILLDGREMWFKNGEIHRDDGPAVICPDGYIEWRQNGEIHRLDGPAIIESGGTEVWYKNGKKHRLDGPAVIFLDGEKHWYNNGELHRLDGPAVILADGTVEWWLNGVEYSYKKWKKILKDKKMFLNKY